MIQTEGIDVEVSKHWAVKTITQGFIWWPLLSDLLIPLKPYVKFTCLIFKDLSNVYNISELFKYWLIVNLSLFYSRYSLAVYHYLFPV